MATKAAVNIIQPTKRRTVDFGDEVTVFVGANAQRFIAHRGTLITSSLFFRAALQGHWRESREKKVHLSDQDPTTFAIYLNWLYYGFIDLVSPGSEVRSFVDTDGDTREHVDGRYGRLIQCYILGTFVQDDLFCDALINCYFDLAKATWVWPIIEECNFVVEKLIETSKLRQLIQDDLSHNSDHTALTYTIHEMHPELVKGMLLAAVKNRNDEVKSIYKRGRCYYHLHGEGEECGQAN